jgi:1-acyl-sn-glycerol-3-phosphate acyltransferase
VLYPDHTQVPRRGSRLLPRLGSAYLHLFGWRFHGDPPNVAKLVLAVAPHTSNWDFLLGVAVMWAIDLRLSFFGKHTLFIWPFSIWMRSIGGIPVNRNAAHGLVGEAIEAFAAREQLWLAIAPEGTRSKVARLKRGFLHIAHGAGVPVQLVAFDYENRLVRFGPVIEPTGDVDADIARIEAYFLPIRGKYKRD